MAGLSVLRDTAMLRNYSGVGTKISLMRLITFLEPLLFSSLNGKVDKLEEEISDLRRENQLSKGKVSTVYLISSIFHFQYLYHWCIQRSSRAISDTDNVIVVSC